MITVTKQSQNENLVHCPFCGSAKIKYSLKTTGRFEKYYHAQFYCTSCHTYGPRVNSEKVEGTYRDRIHIEQNTALREQAKEAWNKRAYNINIDIAETNN
jgi:transposase-like protein